jgi:hypothetical protein
VYSHLNSTRISCVRIEVSTNDLSSDVVRFIRLWSDMYLVFLVFNVNIITFGIFGVLDTYRVAWCVICTKLST